jgi:hypothetical protein
MGAVVGINTQIHISEQPGVGKVVHPQLNFALESRIARRLVDEIIAKGRVARAYLGVVFTQEAGPLSLAAAGKSPEIALLVPGSPAAQALAGAEEQPVTAVNGVPVKTLEQLFSELEKVRPGAQVRFTFAPGTPERSVISRELDDSARRQDVRAFLRGFASLDVEDNGGSIRIIQARCDDPGQTKCGRRSQLRILKDGEIVTKIPEGFAQDVTISAGATADEGGPAWRVGRLEDLDTSLRQNALLGSLLFLSKPDEEADAIQLELRRGLFATLKATLY